MEGTACIRGLLLGIQDELSEGTLAPGSGGTTPSSCLSQDVSHCSGRDGLPVELLAFVGAFWYPWAELGC